MNHSGFSLSDFFRDSRDRGEPLVLATIARTLGSTYRKAGAQMLLAGDGRAAGLLSGGCLEADLMERARAVLAGSPVVADYDTRSSDDLIWGIGLGCEGAMTILLTRLDRANDYQPFAFVEQLSPPWRSGQFRAGHAIDESCISARRCVPFGLRRCATRRRRRSAARDLEPARRYDCGDRRRDVPVAPVELPPRLLVLGAGPDTMPLVGNRRTDELARDGARSSPCVRGCRALSARTARRVESCGGTGARVAGGALRCGDRNESSPAVGPGVSRRARRARNDSLHRTARPRAAPRATHAGAR